MLEVYVLVEKKRSVLLNVLELFLWVLTVLFGALALLGASILIWLALFLGVAAYFIHTRRYEYEYSYFDGDVRFAKIINKSSRKRLGIYNIEEILVIAPIEDRSMYQYVNDSQVKHVDYTSRNKDAKIYGMVAKTANGLTLIHFEPDEKYLDAVCVKYRQKVIR